MNPETICVKFLCGPDLHLGAPSDSETIREWFERVIPGDGIVDDHGRFLLPKHQDACNKTLEANMIVKGKTINTHQNRHKNAKQLLGDANTIHSSLWIGGLPGGRDFMVGNLNADHNPSPIDNICAICLGYEADIDLYKKHYMIMLPCRHRFHLDCITKITSSKCPVCQSKSNFIVNLGRACKKVTNLPYSLPN